MLWKWLNDETDVMTGMQMLLNDKGIIAVFQLNQGPVQFTDDSVCPDTWKMFRKAIIRTLSQTSIITDGLHGTSN